MVRLRKRIDNIARELRAEEKGLKLACEVAANVPERIVGDPVRLDLKGIDEPVKAFRLAPPNSS